VAPRDYRAWHDGYDRPGSRLHLRLLVVQDLIAQALDDLAPGPVRVVSLCAGQGRDVLGVARRHRRGGDLTGRLVELDAANVAAARATIAAAGLAGIEAVAGDAGLSDAYVGAAPADLVLACGIFGNVSDADVEGTVRFLPALSAPGAWVVWTRFPREDGLVDRIRGWFAEAGFEERALVVPEAGLRFGVGAARYAGGPVPLAAGRRLFSFVR
jgi:Putative methyltransferase